MKQLKTIGASEYIDFPKLGIKGVPARIDTSARSSSIHAADINTLKKDGRTYLVFKLDRFNNIQVEADDFSVSSVKSSNGQTEQRFVVKLTVNIAGSDHKTDFTLTDRSKMTFPVLIGRRLLKGRYIVDVSKKLETDH